MATATQPASAQFLTTELTTIAIRGYLFALSQFCRSVSDLTDEDYTTPLSHFHSAEEPSVDLADYVLGVAYRLRLHKDTVLRAITYVALHAKRSGRSPSIMSAHRLFASALLLAAKVQGERFGKEPAFAAVTGLSATELLDLSLIISEAVISAPVDDTRMHAVFVGLECARRKTLRSELALAVAAALDLPVPQRSLSSTRRAVDLTDTPNVLPSSAGPAAQDHTNGDAWLATQVSPSVATSASSSCPPSLTEFPDGSSSAAWSPHGIRSSVAGSASNAVRSLRQVLNTSLSSSSSTTPVPESPLTLPTFVSQFAAVSRPVPDPTAAAAPPSRAAAVTPLPPSFFKR